MAYEEAIELAYQVKWKTSTCGQGESCWCRSVEPESEMFYIENGTDFEQPFYIVGHGRISKEFAEYFVELHNRTIEF